MKFVQASAQLISVLLLTQHTLLPFVHGIPSATSTEQHEDYNPAVSNTVLFCISCKN